MVHTCGKDDVIRYAQKDTQFQRESLVLFSASVCCDLSGKRTLWLVGLQQVQ